MYFAGENEHAHYFSVEPVIKFESETASTGNATTVAAVPSTSGVVIVIDGETSSSTGKGRGKKRRNQDEEVIIVQEKKATGKVSIPNYLNEDPPTSLKLLSLRKHALISQIERNYSEKLWYDQSRSLLPHLKRMIASMPFGKVSGDNDKDEHGYSFPPPHTDNTESDIDI